MCHWSCGKDIERIHRNLGHASADQLEKLFRDANVSDDAVSALKHFRCDACDRLKYPPSKRKVAVNHAETFNDIVSMDVNFWKITFKESPRVKTTLKVLKHRGCRIGVCTLRFKLLIKLPRPSGELSRQVG